jgi:outer membrane protein TolC
MMTESQMHGNWSTFTRIQRIRATAFAVLLGFGSAARAQGLTLDEALRVAEQQSPRLVAQRAMVSSAGHQAARASELPDPKLRLGIDNLPVTGEDRFRYDRDFMTMRSVGWMQDFPNQAKREARGVRAGRARDVEEAMLTSQRVMLNREVALAWFEVYFAERARDTLEALVRQFAAQADTVAAGLARGKQTAAEGFMLRGAVEQTRDRVIDQERLISRARAALAAFLGEEAKRALGAPPELAVLTHGREALIGRLHEHPMLRVLDQREGLARAEVDLAKTAKISDWSLEVGYSHRRPEFSNMVSVMVAFELPWQAERRQDRDIASKLAEVEQANALREDARRMHEAELRSWLVDHETAAKRIERFRTVLLPLARDRVSAALAAYQGGRGELALVLEANRAVTETELARIGVESERARAWANLSFQYPHEAAK